MGPASKTTVRPAMKRSLSKDHAIPCSRFLGFVVLSVHFTNPVLRLESFLSAMCFFAHICLLGEKRSPSASCGKLARSSAAIFRKLLRNWARPMPSFCLHRHGKYLECERVSIRISSTGLGGAFFALLSRTANTEVILIKEHDHYGVQSGMGWHTPCSVLFLFSFCIGKRIFLNLLRSTLGMSNECRVCEI